MASNSATSSNVVPGVETASELITAIASCGGRVELDGDDLIVRVPPEGLSPELAAQLKAAKPAVLAFLRRARNEVGPSTASVTPVIAPDPRSRHDPFPLNENQQAYWLGRDDFFESGEVAIRLYVEIERDGLDLNRLERAWRRLISHHDMLRAVVLPDGRQQVLAEPPDWALPVDDLSGLLAEMRDEVLAALREDLSHECPRLEVWPTWTLRAARIDAGLSRVFIGLDCWAIDGRSWQILFGDLATLYADPDAVLPDTALTFRDYALASERARQESAYADDLAYWQSRLDTLPGPAGLPQLKARPGETRPRFRRRSMRLEPDRTAALKRRAAAAGVTLASTLLGAYAEVLERWGGTRHFTVNVPRWNRLPLHPDVDQVVGEFATFTLLEVDNRPGGDTATRFRRLQGRLWQDLDHAGVSGVRVLRDWRRRSPDAPPAAIPYIFTEEPPHPDGTHGPREQSWMASLSRIGNVVSALTQTPQVWIDCQYHELDGALLCFWDGVDAKFPDGMLDDMFEAYTDLIGQLADEDAAWTDETPLRLPPRQIAIREATNDTGTPVETVRPWAALYDHATSRGDAEAVIDREGRIGWRALADGVDALAAKLVAAGVAAGDPVALVAKKGAGQVVGALALHRLGAVMVAIDPDLPTERFDHILFDCGAGVALSDRALMDGRSWPEDGPRWIALTPHDPVSPQEVASGHALPPPPDDRLHCIIYTSGSTGLPKGVMVPWDGVANMMADAQERFSLGPDDAILSLAPLYHDLALFDVIACVLAGARIVLPDPDRTRDPGHWIEQMRAERVTLWNSVPAMMTMLLDYADGVVGASAANLLPNLRMAILGGDWLPVDTPARLSQIAPACLLWSSGGPTETTGWNILFPVTDPDPDWPSIPYGRPIRNVRYHVLDGDDRDCPEWVVGELCCTGAGITLGYLNDPERTSQSFGRHPRTGERMFRTGDLGRWLPDGTIEFMGRRDFRVNVNGVRIELGEIEAQLARHPGVSRAVAVALREPGGQAVRSIAAFAICQAPTAVAASDERSDTTELPDTTELHAFLAERLPRLAMPGRILILDAVPLTANGKIDRTRLAAKAAEQDDADQTGAAGNGRSTWQPETEAERLVTEAWTELLGAPPSDPEQDLFAAGGDSIAAISLYTRLLAGRVAGSSVMSVFRASTPRALSALVAAATEGDGVVEDGEPSTAPLPVVESVPLPRPSRGPATAAQLRLWLEESVTGDRSAYVLAFSIGIHGAVQPEGIASALSAVVAADEALRTRIVAGVTGEPEQIVDPAASLPLPLDDLSKLRRAAREAKAQEVTAEEAGRGLDLGRDGPLRARLIRLSARRWRLLLTFHHVAIDGGGIGRLLDGFAAALDGVPVPVPTIQPIDYARWERLPAVRKVVEGQIEWWRTRLADCPAPTEIETGRPRPRLRRYAGGLESAVLPATVGRDLSNLARRAGAPPFAGILASVVTLLHRWSGEDQIVIGTHVGLRDRPELANATGLMVNSLALAIPVADDPSFATVLERVATHLAEAWRNGLAPFERVFEAVGAERDPSRHPLFGIGVVQEGLAPAERRAGGLTIKAPEPVVRRAHQDLEISVRPEADGGLRLSATHALEIIDAETARMLLHRLQALLQRLIADPDLPVSAHPLTETEDEVAIAKLHAQAATAWEGPMDLAQLWESRLKDDPERPLLLDPAGTPVLDAAGLERRAALIAAGLRDRGIARGDRVAVSLGRTPDLIAAQLALWRLGAIYAPLGLNQPKARAEQILSGLDPAAVIGTTGDKLSLDDLAEAGQAAGGGWTGAGAGPADGAVIHHTSGSTGQPKAVLLTHGGFANRLRWQWFQFPYEADDRVLARTAIDFADSIAETMAPLFAGIPVAQLDEGATRDPFLIARAAAASRATRLLVVPSLLSALLDLTEPGDFNGIRLWTSSGEPLSPQLAARALAAWPEARLINIYGSTEVTADAAWDEVKADGAPVPAGWPIANAELHILDAKDHPLPCGIPGRLGIAGAVVAPGYPDDTQGTAARFVNWQGRRLCLTGDRALRLDDGRILILGRSDSVVKIRGQRITIGEVEAALAAVAGTTAVAVARVDGDEGTMLVAGVELPGGTDGQILARQLRNHLPPAAIPSRIVPFEALPRTSAGKIDRPGLAAGILSMRPSGSADGTAPANPVERRLAALWSQVLGVEAITREDDFFDLGGHSLAAARLSARVRREFGCAVTTGFVFEVPSLAAMAAALEVPNDRYEEVI